MSELVCPLCQRPVEQDRLLRLERVVVLLASDVQRLVERERRQVRKGGVCG